MSEDFIIREMHNPTKLLRGTSRIDKKLLCKTCKYFIEKDPSFTGHCRKYAPTIKGFPVVYDSDWCGEHVSKSR
jgi:hypothetical protein